jgi:cyclopropane-fatty-acyl-phospholipid synthase
MFDAMDTPRSLRVLLQGWEEFDEPVDRIVSIGAFEHLGHERHPAFFRMAYEALPADGVMLLHSICGRHPKDAEKLGIPLTFELARFVKFIMTEIFPGGRLPSVPMVEERAAEAGFRVSRVQSLQPHYARTLDLWAEAQRTHQEQAVAIQSQEVYDRYMKYLTGCAKLFRQGQVDVNQFTLQK